MAARSLIEIVQAVAPRIGLRAPTLALLSQDLNIQKLVQCVQETGEDALDRHDWSILTTQYTVPTLAAEAQTAFPADFDRMAERAEIWNRSTNLKYDGPIEPDRWDELRALSIGVVGVAGVWRIIGDVLHILPAPTAGQTLAFTYIANTWAKKADGTPQSRFLLDTDLPRILPDTIFIYGSRYRFKEQAGLDYAEDMATYERHFERRASHNRGLRVIRKRSGSAYGSGSTYPGVING
jgi:hypothetical protein